MDSPCAFKDVSVDWEEYAKAAQMALEIYICSTGSDPKSLCFALTQSLSIPGFRTRVNTLLH